MNFRIVFCFLFCVFSISKLGKTQEYEIKWGELQRKGGDLVYLLPKAESEFYALRWSGGKALGSYQLSHHEELVLKESIRIKPIVNKSISTFEAARIIDGLPVIFLSDKRDGKLYYYMQRFTSDLKKDGEAIYLAEFEQEKKRRRGAVDVKVSKNGKFFGVVWSLPGKKEKRHVYGFKIFEKDLTLIQEGEYPLPFEADLSMIHEHYVSNNGDYFLCSTEFQKPEKEGLFKKPSDFKALHVFHINEEEGLQDVILDLDGKNIVALALTSDSSNVFTLTGVYGEGNSEGVSGAFYRKMNLLSGKVLNEGFKPFDEDFITENWSDHALRRSKRRKEAGKGNPYLFNYRMRDAVFMDDGSIVGTMEQYYVQMKSNPDVRSVQSSNVYYYYYNDIIVYKVNPSGSFEWVKKIRKYQVSVNDGGPYSSYESFLDEGKIHFIFNDDRRNYDSTGVFTDNKDLHTANFGRRKNVVALTSIDLENGNLRREVFFDRVEIKALAVPKMFNVNYNIGQILLYSTHWKKEKIGSIKIKESYSSSGPP